MMLRYASIGNSSFLDIFFVTRKRVRKPISRKNLKRKNDVK